MCKDGDDRQLTLSDWKYECDQYQYTSDCQKSTFIVEVKKSAIEANSRVDKLVETEERFLKYESRREAEIHTEQLTERGEVRIALQKTAPQDNTEADVYMISQPERHIQDPVNPSADVWKFGVGANQYGAIGEALITSPGSSPPALTYYIEQDLECSEEEKIRVRLKSDIARSECYDEGGRSQTKIWIPDCIAQAERRYEDETIGGEYWCEIKTGNASFERSQIDLMRQKATEPEITVIKARVELDDLPKQYSVRFHKIDPDCHK